MIEIHNKADKMLAQIAAIVHQVEGIETRAEAEMKREKEE